MTKEKYEKVEGVYLQAKNLKDEIEAREGNLKELKRVPVESFTSAGLKSAGIDIWHYQRITQAALIKELENQIALLRDRFNALEL